MNFYEPESRESCEPRAPSPKSEATPTSEASL